MTRNGGIAARAPRPRSDDDAAAPLVVASALRCGARAREREPSALSSSNKCVSSEPTGVQRGSRERSVFASSSSDCQARCQCAACYEVVVVRLVRRRGLRSEEICREERQTVFLVVCRLPSIHIAQVRSDEMLLQSLPFTVTPLKIKKCHCKQFAAHCATVSNHFL